MQVSEAKGVHISLFNPNLFIHYPNNIHKMLDINIIRNDYGLVKANLEKRQDPALIIRLDEAVKLDRQWKHIKAQLDELRRRSNIISQQINSLMKEKKKQEAEKLIAEMKSLPKLIADEEEKEKTLAAELKEKLMRIPNLLHDSVPFGKDDSENKVVRKWGEPRKFNFELKPHGELIESLNGGDFAKAAEVSGNGFYYLMGDVALLEMAIQRFAIDVLTKKGYTLVTPPYMIRKRPYEGVTDLGDFETMMYKIEGEDLYLIATSEHPLVALFLDETIDESKLPIKLVGFSPCFRKEIGSSGVDTKGVFRVHQFNKVEQVIICRPEDSWKLHEELIANSEELMKALEIPYQVVNICTGDIGIVAAKKYDIECWVPRENKYREIVSCSNCTSYQAVRSNMKYKKGSEKMYPHTLNSTALPTSSRALRAILENYQNEDGSVTVPDVLVSYMNGKKLIKP